MLDILNKPFAEWVVNYQSVATPTWWPVLDRVSTTAVGSQIRCEALNIITAIVNNL